MDNRNIKHPFISGHALRTPRIWPQAYIERSDLVWSPDGSHAAYLLKERWYRPKVISYLTSLCVIWADGREARRLYTGQDGELALSNSPEPETAAWSPDSQRILFWKCYFHTGSANADGSPLYDVSLKGGTPRLLTVPFRSRYFGQDEGIMRHPDNLAFSPDGRRLLLVAGFSRYSGENKRLSCLDYRSGKRLWITDADWAAGDPAWSSDSQQIAFTQMPDRNRLGSRAADTVARRESLRHLWIMDADGNGRHQLTNDPRYRESKPQWIITRNGLTGKPFTVIRFVRDDNADLTNSVLWEIRPDRTGLRKLRDLPPEKTP